MTSCQRPLVVARFVALVPSVVPVTQTANLPRNPTGVRTQSRSRYVLSGFTLMGELYQRAQTSALFLC